ncbi:MAG TPA: hypothetical protein VF498_06735 [Anaerolineales bacterium]
MNEPGSQDAGNERPSQRGAWAAPVSTIKVSEVPPGATNINVEGRRTSGALQGFGQLWQKTYKVRLSDVNLAPAEVMAVWKQKFAEFQPPENRFYPPMTGIKPNEVLFIEGRVPALPGTPSIMPVSSGVMVLYVDDEMFTIMTPEGFPESGWNTFSVIEEDGCPVAQIQSMARAADPLYEFYFRFLGSAEQQEKTWTHVLTSLAGNFKVNGQVSISKTCLDPKIQWSYAGNIWKSAAIRTVLYKLAAPLRWVGLMKSR